MWGFHAACGRGRWMFGSLFFGSVSCNGWSLLHSVGLELDFGVNGISTEETGLVRMRGVGGCVDMLCGSH